MPSYDYVIIGSGIAGLYASLLAKEHGSVLIVTKGTLDECNTRYAQGGIAAAVGPGDSPEEHIRDTLEAGAGLCNGEAVRILCTEAADRIADLARYGVPFDTVHGEVALAREAAHSHPRILHAGGDATGMHIEQTLANLARSSGVTILEYSLAMRILVDGGTARGIEVLDERTGSHQEVEGRFIILATGGAGRLFRFTTNPSVATGDGVALAYSAGAEIADMEFFQFHPTALRLPGVAPFLISEAVRGEGGILRNVHGYAFMQDYSPQKELAPRDIVARAILSEMRKTSSSHVLLDVTHLPPQRIATRFPTISSYCLQHGLDITRSPVPVAPAAHYMMGGIKTDVWGATNIPNLLACGEAACTGVHGANRLASNSLLETVVFGQRVIERTKYALSPASKPCPEGQDILTDIPARPTSREQGPMSLSALQSLLWDKVGIIRDGAGLTEALDVMASWQAQLRKPTDRPSAELANTLLLGRLMAEAALVREESRGAHFRTDFPSPSERWKKHIVFRKGSPLVPSEGR